MFPYTSGSADALAKVVNEFNLFAERLDLIGRVSPDHICYRCASVEEYDLCRKHLKAENATVFQYESIVNGRYVTVARLTKPVKTVLGDIWFLELQEPKRVEPASFHHFEFVPRDRSYEEELKRFEDARLEIEHDPNASHLTHDVVLPGKFLARMSRESLLPKVIGEMQKKS